LADDLDAAGARDVAGRVPAHAVGDDVEPELLVDEVAVLVVAALATDVGDGPGVDGHSSLPSGETVRSRCAGVESGATMPEGGGPRQRPCDRPFRRCDAPRRAAMLPRDGAERRPLVVRGGLDPAAPRGVGAGPAARLAA